NLRRAILPGPLLHHLLCNLRKPIPLSYNRNVAMHLTIHFYTYNNPRLIGLQPTVEVVDINPRNKACYIIEKFGGNCLRDRIVPRSEERRVGKEGRLTRGWDKMKNE